MCIEYIRFHVPVTEQPSFMKAIQMACRVLDYSTGCLNYEVAGCIEDTPLFVWRIEWVSMEAHLNVFRKEEMYEAFVEEMKPFLGYIVEMNHYNTMI